MKRCPECRRDYYDETLMFCLDDGARLLSGPTADLPPTAVYRFPESPFESPTIYMGAAAPSVAKPASDTIAVLPFINLTRDEEGDYFSDGLAEELLNVLSKIQGLRVAARTSAFSFKGKRATVAEIGQMLNVASVLEGSVRKAAERVRIAVQLTKVEDGFNLWSESYDRTMNDIFAVQDDIARSVVEEIRVRLLGERSDSVSRQVVNDVARAVRGRSDDAEAQRLLMLGRHFLDRTTHQDTERAIDCFKQAMDIDPDFALCWAELGRAYSVGAGRGWLPVDEAFKMSRDAAERALALEPELAEAHAQLGRIKAVYEWDLEGADASYRRALELAPSSASVLDGASVLAYKLGRMEKALDLSRRSLAHDPLSAGIWHNLGLTCHAAGLFYESERAFRRALEIAPQRNVTNALLALVLMDKGQADAAASQTEKEPDEFWQLWSQAIILYAAGNREGSDAALQKLVDEKAEGNAFQIAEIYAMRNDPDQAFDWLQKAVEARDPGVTHTKVNPRFLPLHDDPRWLDALAKVGF